MTVGIGTDRWSGTRWPPSHLASGLPTAPSAEPCSRSGLHAFRSRMVPHSAFWNVSQGRRRETGCIQELQRASPCRCPIGSIRPGCFGDSWSWGKNALPVRNSCVCFPWLSVVTYVIEVFAQLPAEMQVFPASFVFLNEAVCDCSVKFPPSLKGRDRDLWATLYREGCLGSELWSVLGSTYIAAVSPLTLPAFPSFFPELSVDQQ